MDRKEIIKRLLSTGINLTEGEIESIICEVQGEPHIYTIHDPYEYLKEFGLMSRGRRQIFNGPSCDRCQHRFGTTSNKEWCGNHWRSDRCNRFKLE